MARATKSIFTALKNDQYVLAHGGVKKTTIKPMRYWEDRKNIQNFLEEIKEKYNLKSFQEWNKITSKQIQSNGGSRLLQKYSMYEIKCMGFPEGKSKFNQPKQIKTSGYWNNIENIQEFLKKLQETNKIENWNLITQKQIISNGGSRIFKYYSMFDLKYMGNLLLNKENNILHYKPSKYWNNKENIINFLNDIKMNKKFNSNDDWNLLSREDIEFYGGNSLLQKYSVFELKCLAFPEGILFYDKPIGFWNKKSNILYFLKEIGNKNQLQSFDDWNKTITRKYIESLNGGNLLLQKYSLFELKCLAFPEGKLKFEKSKREPKPFGFWEDKSNILHFLNEIKEKYNFNTPNDWNNLSTKQIQLHGGSSLLQYHSLYDIKCLACPEGKLLFDKPNSMKPFGYWKNRENILQFLNKVKEKYNLQSPDDWNEISQKEIYSMGGGVLLNKFSLYELKCLACPEGKVIFDKPKQTKGFWEDKNNILQFLNEIKEKYNLNSPNDWNNLSTKQIQLHGGNSLFQQFSLYDIKCLACPEGKLLFDKPKPSGYWKDKENILSFLFELKMKYKLYSANDWNDITQIHIQSNGGGSLLCKYSMYELKCMAYPEGESIFDKPIHVKSSTFWENKQNRDDFFEKLKEKYNLYSPNDWKRLSTDQIRSEGGNWLFYTHNEYLQNTQIEFEIFNEDNEKKYLSYSLKDLLESNFKRSSQRWLFLQIQKLFPGEEIVEDYFHSEISRESGFSVQFDIFLIHKKIAIEYHGRHHYEDFPSAFAPLETHQTRDLEKEKLCNKYGIQLIIIPYWWDNKLDSLRETLYSAIKL